MNKFSLFLDSEKTQNLSGTFIGSLGQFLYVPWVSEVLVCLAAIVLFFGASVTNATHVPISVATPWLLITALIFCDKKKISLVKANYWYLSFVLAIILSAFIAAFNGVDSHLLLLGVLLFLQFGFAFLIGQSLEVRRILHILITLGVPLSLLAIYQALSNFRTPAVWVSASEAGLNRAFATFGSPNVLGILMVFLTLSSLYLFMESRKWWYLIPTALFSATALITYSRTAWLALLISVLVALAIYKHKVLIYSPVVFLLLLIPQVRNRIANALSPNYYIDSSLDGRVWSWINGLHLLSQRFLLGFGPGTYGGQLAVASASPVYLLSIQNGYTALPFTDNQFLELLVQTGILGLITFVGFLYALLVKLFVGYNKNKNFTSLLGISTVVGLVISGLFANVLEFGAVAIPTGLILGAAISES